MNDITPAAKLDLPEQIRGFGHVKEQAVAEYRARRQELLSGNIKKRAA
jgi:indolepyruvate ferredoxin oxidoreductase